MGQPGGHGLVVPVAYFAIMLGRLGEVPAADISYQRPLLIAIGASVVLTIIGSILAGIGSGISAELHGRSASGGRDRPQGRARHADQPARRPHRVLRGLGRRGRRAGAHDARGTTISGSPTRSTCRSSSPCRRDSSRSPPIAGASSHGQADEGHQQHPGAPVRRRRDDAGGAGRPDRGHAADRHRHRAGTLLAVARDGLQDRRVFDVPLDDVFQYPKEK